MPRRRIHEREDNIVVYVVCAFAVRDMGCRTGHNEHRPDQYRSDQ